MNAFRFPEVLARAGAKRYFALLTWVASVFVFVSAGAQAPVFETEILPLIEVYCMDCHNVEEMEGELDLERFGTMDNVLDSIALWQRIGMRIDKKEMPPKKRDKPTDEERALVAEWVASLKLDDGDCDRIASEESVSWYPGYVMSRRLTRAEYENTLRDLLGVEIRVAQLFPADGAGGEGFDTTGSALFLTAIQLEKYLEAADLAIESALPPKKLGHPAGSRRTGAGFRRWANEDRRLSVVRDRLMGPAPPRRQDRDEAARAIISGFVERSWRRPVDSDEVERFLAMFRAGIARGHNYESALKLVFKAALVSPHFLFLAEPEPDRIGDYALGAYPLASRLSYFLWASMPDDELIALADRGRLQDETVLRGQVWRMLHDPRARALGDLFAAQWLGIVELGSTIRPDPDLFPEFDDALSDSMHGETSRFFNRIVMENRSLIELIDADYTFVNEGLAKLYGLPNVRGGELRLIELAGGHRGGVLGMAAVLTATSHAVRTSPVLRGKWVLERLLGDHVPAPPPDVPPLPDEGASTAGQSLRSRLEAHRKQAECASCHSRMDPLGFGLENFDAIGRWREMESGMPIDARGELPSGEQFDGPGELKQILLQRKEKFARNLARKMLGYALGRSLNRYDECVVDRCVEAMQATDYRAFELFSEIVLSYPFRHRYSSGRS